MAATRLIALHVNKGKSVAQCLADRTDYTLLATDPTAQGKLIVRRNRDIGKGTGTLLSPTDRRLGDEHPDDLVLTMYKITGNKDKGWDGTQIWIPNIKLPGDCAYYSGEN